MQEFNHHFQQLPSHIQSELTWYVGSLNSLSLVQILTRHIAAADHWISNKSANHRYSADISDIFSNGSLGKQEMEALKNLADTQMSRIPQSSFAQGLASRLTIETIRYLTQFKNSLLPIQARAQAEEAARQLAQRQAEEAARQLARRQAEEAAHQLAQRQAEEAARQLSQRQADEAARQLARQQAEIAVLSVVRPRIVEIAIKQLMERVTATLNQASKTPVVQPSGNLVILVTGPKAMDIALSEAEHDIRSAIADFSQAVGPRLEALSAMLHAFKQNGLDTQRIGEAVLQP